MDAGAGHSVHLEYVAFLRGRWPARAKLLARVAAYATFVPIAFDLVGGAGTLAALAARLPWLVVPAASWPLVRWGARWRGLPAVTVALCLAWTLGNDAACLALGTAPAIQSVFVLSCFITAATFLPVTMRGRVGVFALMALGHLGLELAWPQARSLGERLGTGAAIAAFAAAGIFIFETVSASQRRAFRLRSALQASVEDLGRFAAEVAHQVNNPLAAVKVNVRWLGEAGGADPAERAQVAQETLEAVDRIARIVSTLEEHADGRAEASEPRPGRARR